MTGVGEPERVSQRGQNQDQAFHQKAGLRLHHRHLPHDAVAAEAQGQHQRHPGKFAQRQALQHHAHRRQGDGDLSGAVDPLFEQERARGHVEQRIEIVAQAGGDGAPRPHRPHIDAPVHPDQRGRRAREPPRSSAAVLAGRRPGLSRAPRRRRTGPTRGSATPRSPSPRRPAGPPTGTGSGADPRWCSRPAPRSGASGLWRWAGRPSFRSLPPI